MKGRDPNRRNNTEKMTPAETAIRAACLAVEALPADERLTRAVDLLERARETVADYVDGVSFLERFGLFQESRDREQEICDYVANTAVRLTDASDKTVKEWALSDLPNFPKPGEMPYAFEWGDKFYRVNAIVPRGIIEGATHVFKNEIVGSEITEADPLRDYEREQPPFKLPN